MNLPKIYLIAILLLAFSVGANSQEPPKPVLVNEYAFRVGREEAHSRIDNFFTELSENKGSTGLVVTFTPPPSKHLGIFREDEVRYYSAWHKFPASRLKFLRANHSTQLKVQLWRIPAEGVPPEIRNIDMSFALPKDIQPFILGSEYVYGGEVCPDPDIRPVLADFLRGNPPARGNVVVRERTKRLAQQKAARIVRDFQRRYGISRARFRIFPINRSAPSSPHEPSVEYWYLP
jgi:hypothetical protein